MVITQPGPRIDDADLSAFETRLGYELPSPYRQFLLQYNGGVPEAAESRDLLYVEVSGTRPAGMRIIGESDVRQLFGLRDKYSADLRYHLNTFSDRLPPGWLAIGSDSGGNLFCIAGNGSARGSIHFWDHETELTVELATDFDGFLAKLRPTVY